MMCQSKCNSACQSGMMPKQPPGPKDAKQINIQKGLFDQHQSKCIRLDALTASQGVGASQAVLSDGAFLSCVTELRTAVMHGREDV